MCILCNANTQGSRSGPATSQQTAGWASPVGTGTIGTVTTFGPTGVSAIDGLLMGTK